jgi:hypothetical protein
MELRQFLIPASEETGAKRWHDVRVRQHQPAREEPGDERALPSGTARLSKAVRDSCRPGSGKPMSRCSR